MPSTLKTLLGLLLFFLAPLSFAANCTLCTTLVQEIAKLTGEEAHTTGLLNGNKTALASMGPNDMSKRIKVTSNILILSARAETLMNTKILKLQDASKQGCDSCPKI